MARESCNLGNDEAEILRPSSPSLSSSPQNPNSPTPPSSHLSPQPPPSSLLLKPSEDFSEQKSGSFEITTMAKLKEVCRQPVLCSHRCSTCRKKVGLTGFRCRCGDLFCGRHRYSDTHNCSFDYKAAGREEISKANPVIRAAKIIKI